MGDEDEGGAVGGDEDCADLMEMIRSPNNKMRRNTVDITGTAMTAIQYEASNRQVGALCSAYLGDLIRSGVLSPDMDYLAVDPLKVQRARERIMTQVREKGESLSQEDTINSIMFDSQLDPTKVKKFDEQTKKFYPRIETQDHYTMTDGLGRYIHHFTKEGKEINEEEGQVSTQKEIKPAEKVANMMLEWMGNYGVDQTLLSVGVDSTNPNTGWKGGVFAWLERKLGRKLIWIICMLHTN